MKPLEALMWEITSRKMTPTGRIFWFITGFIFGIAFGCNVLPQFF